MILGSIEQLEKKNAVGKNHSRLVTLAESIVGCGNNSSMDGEPLIRTSRLKIARNERRDHRQSHEQESTKTRNTTQDKNTFDYEESTGEKFYRASTRSVTSEKNFFRHLPMCRGGHLSIMISGG